MKNLKVVLLHCIDRKTEKSYNKKLIASFLNVFRMNFCHEDGLPSF